MSIHVALHHRTTYNYDRAVLLSPQVIRLRPAPHTRTPILSYSIRVTPEKHFINWQQDPFANWQARYVFPEKVTKFTVEVDLVAQMAVFNPFDFFVEAAAESFPFSYAPDLRHDLAPYLAVAPAGPLLQQFLGSIDTTKRNTVSFLVDLNRRIQQEISYIIRLEPGVYDPEETLSRRRGSCRDSAWLMVNVLRHLGLAARFVSGYLIQLAPDQKSLDGPSGTEVDFTDLHAWCEVFLPGAGWIGFDPTSGLLAGEGHIPLACTPEPRTAAAITGEVEACEVDFQFEMKVSRFHESPRVTKPYTEEDWAEIDRLGDKVDSLLEQLDVRLTMGGEPTFVSIDDMDGPEWNVSAVGPNKRALSLVLLRRMQERFAPGGLLHFGQGKWYPGEQLPRFAFGCYWRRDGQPIWRDQALVGDERINYGFTSADSKRFIDALCERLGVETKFVLPAREDAFHYLLRERRLPVNVDPFKSELRDPEERARLARVFSQGLEAVVGHVLPLQRNKWGWGQEWTSGPWFMRVDNLLLIPGDSPIGFRLPMDSLPWVPTGDYPYIEAQDPFDTRTPLPPRPARDMQPRRHVAPSADSIRQEQIGQHLPPVARGASPGAGTLPAPNSLIRTALCVEPRNGRMYVFLPPVRKLEDYLDLVAAIEETAAQLDMPVIIEGYTPPNDSRLNVFKVTPDPGVIEVNIHPSKSWRELCSITTSLYEEARQSRLGTEKFMIDGRHTGTGGGNHVVIGAETPADSPFLRRPDLLRSLVAYWNNHPSLSYLFSSLFIGPTSQSPRVDEARHDALYELEIAFKQVEGATEGAIPPWLTDRLFRNLLVDSTGNTHRAEFCIDKLYSPDSSSGRLGLLEMRGLEMPPHARMSLTQQLLIRSLIARFWRQPYEGKLVRWGTSLHDKFMLPYWVWQDFEDVIWDLQEHGFAFKRSWFAPHFEFRFPFVGQIEKRGINLELRTALEPWHVLGEESSAGGTVRYVDSSLERLQVKITGMLPERHRVLCNGKTVPLHPTGTNGEFVAGVRFKAWQLASGLHPTIPVHSPLTFDIVDEWSQRSMGGCTYHVAHPAGRNYTTFPVNAYEAESRRLARFSKFGHTTGVIRTTAAQPHPLFPMTLDLRA
jgi:uncharacterized protein (DUF2126 family)/transglutaminase-like putative cysteine protease